MDADSDSPLFHDAAPGVFL